MPQTFKPPRTQRVYDVCVVGSQLGGVAAGALLARRGYRVLHVAARLTHGARQTRLRIDKTWRWATQIAEGFHRLRVAFG